MLRLTFVETRIHEIEMRKRQHEELRGKEEEWRLAHPQPLPKQQADVGAYPYPIHSYPMHFPSLQIVGFVLEEI